MCSLTLTVAHTHKVRMLVKVKRNLRRSKDVDEG